MTDATTNRHLNSRSRTPKVVKAGLRAWSEHLAHKRAARAEADTAEAEPVRLLSPSSSRPRVRTRTRRCSACCGGGVEPCG